MSLVLVARLALAAILLIAGLSKLTDAAGFRRTLRSIGLPHGVVRVLALGVPLAELGAASALLFRSTAFAGALAGVGLLSAFTAFVLWVVTTGRQVDCRCFGQLHGGAAVGWPTLYRNLGFLALASATLWGSRVDAGPGVPELLSAMTIVHFLLAGQAIALTGLAGLGFMLWLQQGRLLLRIEDLEGRPASRTAGPGQPAPRGAPIGAVAPTAVLRDSSGSEVDVRDLPMPERPVFLLFAEADCAHCRTVVPHVGGWAAEAGCSLRIGVVTDAPSRAALARELDGTGVELYTEWEGSVSAAFGVEAVPSAVLVRTDRRVGSRLAEGPDAIRALLEGLGGTMEGGSTGTDGRGSRPRRANLPEAQPGGAGNRAFALGSGLEGLRLRTADGGLVPLGDGVERLLLFWNPDCPFCTEMLPELRRRQRERARARADLVLVSRRPLEGHDLDALLVVDERSEVAARFGVLGTPAAVLVDGESRIASELVHGSREVLAVLGPESRDAPARQGDRGRRESGLTRPVPRVLPESRTSTRASGRTPGSSPPNRRRPTR